LQVDLARLKTGRCWLDEAENVGVRMSSSKHGDGMTAIFYLTANISFSKNKK
jgi:hypothetical protein